MLMMFTHRFVVGLFILFTTAATRAADFFVAPNGNDGNPGTLANPFASIQRAQQAVAAGDTVYVRGGTYVMRDDQIAKKERIWAYVILLDKSGTPDKRINYVAYQSERPVFDF